jgi:signal transduction histidine kinase
MPALKSTAITPSAARLTESLRDIGYDFSSAVADIVDNSIMAGATRVEILIEFGGLDSSVTVSDNGCGMTANGLVEALRYGTRRTYSRGDLGRYGLGLKTASLPVSDGGDPQFPDRHPDSDPGVGSGPDR